MSAANFIDNATVTRTVQDILPKTTFSEKMVRRGVENTASLWQHQDGDAQAFHDFCVANYCKNETDKQLLFERFCRNFEIIMGYNNRLNIELRKPLDVQGFAPTSVDSYFASYDALAHLHEDMYSSKLAFIITLNFPFYTLREKNNNGHNWSDLLWGYVRLGDLFTSRVPAQALQKINEATTAAEKYIANYNIYMGMVWSDENRQYWGPDQTLPAHWGLRDELKAAYSDKQFGLDKQIILYNIMKRIVNQTILKDVIDKDEYIWFPSTNQVFISTIEIEESEQEENIRYQYLLDVFKAVKAADKYYPKYPTFIDRTFDAEYEITAQEAEQIFAELLSSPMVKKVAALISKRLGRKLEPHDIWYNGFKTRTDIPQSELDAKVRAKYPTKLAFEQDLPNIMNKLGFSARTSKFVCDRVTVEPAVGSGHALEAMMKNDHVMLRTRFGKNGLDYKGYNIGIHEFGHNVEQILSLHNVPNYFLAGVPNIACTEALAFTFQHKDLELLGVTPADELTKYFNTLDIFWNSYEIMGVALVDMKVWQWLYNNPNTTADDLKYAVLRIAKEVWNQYYAPVFGVKDEIILAVYSHMIEAPLYLASYPLGHLIDFQLEHYYEGKNIGAEVERIYSQGRLTPKLWMKRAVGREISALPLIEATTLAMEKVNAYDKQVAKQKKQAAKKK